MRPVDRKSAAVPAWYNQTFDNTTGAPMLILHQTTYANALAATALPAPANLTLGAAVFRHFVGPLPVTAPVLQQPAPLAYQLGSVRVQNPQQPHQLAQVVIGSPDRIGNPQVTLNPVLRQVQIDLRTGSRQVLRLLLPAVEASELVRLHDEDVWNGPPFAAVVPGPVEQEIRRLVNSTHPVQNNPAARGYYGYRGAIRELAAHLGCFCSYCEAKWQDASGMDVEHRNPKSYYASEALLWENFLLGCVACNQRFKGARPNRVTGIQYAPSFYPPNSFVQPQQQSNAAPARTAVAHPNVPARLPYHSILRACNEFHICPDLDDAGTLYAPQFANPGSRNYSLLAVRYELWECQPDGTFVRAINMADALHPRNESIATGFANTVFAWVYDQPLNATRPLHVRVRAIAGNVLTNSGLFNLRKWISGNNTIAMVGLNAASVTFGDQRVVARTRAWFKALEMAQLLIEQHRYLAAWQQIPNLNVLQVLNPATMIDKQWNQACSAAEAGYYSVWLKVFRYFNVWVPNRGNINLAAEIATRLDLRAAVAAATAAAAAWPLPVPTCHYNGTNVGNSVIPMIPLL